MMSHALNFTPLKEIVSKRRNRYRQDGFNLDLTYITQKLIAMGFPASNIEGCYRNHIDDVVSMLDLNHFGHYCIYNLCSERSYQKEKFHNRVKHYPFDDHNPPRLDIIGPFCADVHDWLVRHEANVAVVHCKAGKGRTGTMICCYLLHCRFLPHPMDALNFYGQARTQDQKGVTIPSQVRYVHYYSRLMREELVYRRVSMCLTEIKLEPPPLFGNRQTVMHFTVYMSYDEEEDGEVPRSSLRGGARDKEDHSKGAKLVKLYKSQGIVPPRGESQFTLRLEPSVPVVGDIKVEVHSKSLLTKKTKLMQFWFNTYIVNVDGMRQRAAAAAAAAAAQGVTTAAAAQKPPPGPSAPQASTAATATTAPKTTEAVAAGDPANGVVTAKKPQQPAVPRSLSMSLRKSELDIINKKDKHHKICPSNFKITLQFQKKPVPEDWVLPKEQPNHLQVRSSISSADSDSDSSEWDSAVECDVNMDPKGVGYTRLLSECDLSTKLNDLHVELYAV